VILGVAEHMGVSGIVVRPLDPPLSLDLEVVWRRPASSGVRRLVDFLVEAADGPEVLVSPPRRSTAATGGSAPPSRSRPRRS
jgi:hypothetical protein